MKRLDTVSFQAWNSQMLPWVLEFLKNSKVCWPDTYPFRKKFVYPQGVRVPQFENPYGIRYTARCIQVYQNIIIILRLFTRTIWTRNSWCLHISWKSLGAGGNSNNNIILYYPQVHNCASMVHVMIVSCCE